MHSVTGVAEQAGVVHSAHERVGLQPARYERRRGRLPLHAQRHRLEAAHRQPAVERPQNAALGILRTNINPHLQGSQLCVGDPPVPSCACATLLTVQ